MGKPVPLEKFAFPIGSPLWNKYVLLDILGRDRSANQDPPTSESSGHSSCKKVREMLSSSGAVWAQANPLRGVKLRGVRGTPRQIEILECVLLKRCSDMKLCESTPLDPADIERAKEGLKWDLSQVTHVRFELLRAH
jgi:hypothetical protein